MWFFIINAIIYLQFLAFHFYNCYKYLHPSDSLLLTNKTHLIPKEFDIYNKMKTQNIRPRRGRIKITISYAKYLNPSDSLLLTNKTHLIPKEFDIYNKMKTQNIRPRQGRIKITISYAINICILRILCF